MRYRTLYLLLGNINLFNYKNLNFFVLYHSAFHWPQNACNDSTMQYDHFWVYPSETRNISSDPIIITPVLLSAVFLLRQPHFAAAAYPVETLERNIWLPLSLSYATQFDLSSTLPTITLDNKIIFIFFFHDWK